MNKKYFKLKDENQSFVDIIGIIDVCKDEEKLWWFSKTTYKIRLNFKNRKVLEYHYTNENIRNKDYELIINELEKNKY
jgi:hypothetical protein